MIDDAKSSIKVAMNVWSYKDISRALVRAKQRGVDVQIVTIQSNKLQEAIAILTSGGIPIKWSESHYKWMLVDDYTFVNGSPNWTVNGFSRSDESFIVLYDLSSEQLSVIYSMWNHL
ncbi:phospholipase D-like domain-containing protein [Parachlamydia acanthamoebae]|uniref:phospholipase D-like domain-containing protein n=1 Tax=Parachlamydia acanthamoebae TaxID=83552 RepID=UPI001305164E|nr:phospholipase D-like domain-containing protein [Parachlamydia acanthamoebae]